jgi:hypothetical protein
MKNLLILLTLLVFSVSTYAQNAEVTQAKQYEVHLTDGKTVKGYGLSYSSGRVRVKLTPGGTGGTTGFTLDKISKIISPKPRQLNSVMDWIKKGDFKRVISVLGSAAGKKFFDDNRYLGWGKRLHFCHSYAMIQTGKADDANALLRKAPGLIASGEDKLDKQLIAICFAAADLSKGKHDSASKKLKAESSNLEPEIKPYFYNIEGDIYAASGKQQLAVISYYKALLLDRTNPWQRGYAKMKITAVYKAAKDPRAGQLRKLK